MAFNVSDNYKTQIYQQANDHRVRILFDGVELEDADFHCEKLTVVSRIIPNGTKNLYLDNLVAKEATLILHSVDLAELTGKVEISIGTLVGNAYEYVPIGIFNIQTTSLTANQKVTLNLRDNSVLLDFNYNALPLMEQLNPTSPQATLKQILDDICSKAGIISNVQNFYGSDITVSIYDNKITARNYVSYIAEQSGALPIIDRYGALDFIYLNNLTTHTLDYFLIEDHHTDIGLNISKVEYESGTIKYTAGNDSADSLFVDASNVYIESQEQIDNIHSIVNGFTIDTLKITKIIGNPAIDSYDIIEIITDEGATYRTLANNTLIYNGVLTQIFDTTISKNEKKTNVTVRNEPNFRKYVKNEIDNLNATWTSTVASIEDLNENYTQLQQTSDSLSITVGNNVADVDNLKQQTSNNTTAIGTMQGTITEMSFNFQTDGLRIGKIGDDVNSTLDNAGLKIFNISKLIAIFNKNGSGIKKLIVTDSIQFQNLLTKKGRKETKRHGTIDVIQGFWLENLIETLEDLEV